jgi:hypothetical protein
MTAKKKQFELLGSLVGHPDYPDAKRGDVLKLEVGDDNLPTSELLRSRVRPLGEDLSGEGDGGDAKAIVKEAKAEAKTIIAKAKEDAAAIVEKANADAAELMAAAAGGAE